MPTSDWTPVVVDLANALRARTRDGNGQEVGTFDDRTRVNGAQALAAIERGVRDVSLVIGQEVPPALWPDARNLAVLAAAMYVELTYFPDQITTGRSPYRDMSDLYDKRIQQLKIAVTAAGGDTDGPEPGAPLPPSFSFPMLGDPFIIGRRTAW